LPFTANVKSFIPYQNNQTISFKNQSGEIWKLTVKESESSLIFILQKKKAWSVLKQEEKHG